MRSNKQSAIIKAARSHKPLDAVIKKPRDAGLFCFKGSVMPEALPERQATRRVQLEVLKADPTADHSAPPMGDPKAGRQECRKVTRQAHSECQKAAHPLWDRSANTCRLSPEPKQGHTKCRRLALV